MTAYTRMNALDQALDIAGSLTQSQTRTLSDEPAGFGLATANTGTSAATLTGPVSNEMTVSALVGSTFTAISVGNFATFSGFANGANNGTFLITAYISATSVKILNAAGIAEVAGSGVTWTERYPYRLEDDLNFVRTDRQKIKGTTNWYDAVPVYQRATAVGTNVPANLTNIAGKTLDAFARCVNRGQFNVPVEATLTDLYGAGNFNQADAVDTTGVPVFDAAPFTGDWNSAFVEVTDFVTGNELEVIAGPQIGQKIFGVTYGGASTSPNNVEIRWYSCANGGDITTGSTAYTWEQGSATAKTGTTTVTVVAGANGVSALTGLTAGGFASPADVGTWLTVSGSVNAANDGTFVIISVQSGTAVTVQNHAAISEAASPSVTWTQHAKTQVTFINVTYGFNERLDQLDQNAFRFPLVTGLVGDADLRQDVNDLQTTIGEADGAVSLAGLLTNTGTFYAFNNLGTATPSVVTALNTLNTQIGNRTYTGPYLTNGQTITASLQALSAAISGSSVTRYIERLGADVNAGTAHTLPGGATYVLDGTFNGHGLAVFARGVLRDPGSVINGDDYSETSTTSITFFAKQKAGDHLNFFVGL